MLVVTDKKRSMPHEELVSVTDIARAEILDVVGPGTDVLWTGEPLREPGAGRGDLVLGVLGIVLIAVPIALIDWALNTRAPKFEGIDAVSDSSMENLAVLAIPVFLTGLFILIWRLVLAKTRRPEVFYGVTRHEAIVVELTATRTVRSYSAESLAFARVVNSQGKVGSIEIPTERSFLEDLRSSLGFPRYLFRDVEVDDAIRAIERAWKR